MKQAQGLLEIKTHGKGLTEITDKVKQWVSAQKVNTGLLTIFIKHTSASLTIQENADPDVQSDLANFFSSMVPENLSLYTHTSEGADDMPAHIRSALTDVQLSIPIASGCPTLGTWQGIYVFEHRSRSHTRSIALHLLGE